MSTYSPVDELTLAMKWAVDEMAVDEMAVDESPSHRLFFKPAGPVPFGLSAHQP